MAGFLIPIQQGVPLLSVRVLNVDDFEPWRHFVSQELRNSPRFQIVDSASDGLEAVRKAQELQPDLIVLDIGLPRLNGIEAARQIRNVSPNSKILFLTENHSPDIAAEALASGGSGYVLKSDAGTDLFAAAEAVMQDRQFVSATLADHDLVANAQKYAGAAD